MKIIEPGHIYKLYNKINHLTGDHKATSPTAGTLVFVNEEKGTEHSGTTTQEVIRALIDRTQHCHDCLHHDLNIQIVYHLRKALTLHEMRAMERKIEKGELKPEHIKTGKDGHFVFGMVEKIDPLSAPPIKTYIKKVTCSKGRKLYKDKKIMNKGIEMNTYCIEATIKTKIEVNIKAPNREEAIKLVKESLYLGAADSRVVISPNIGFDFSNIDVGIIK